MAGATSWDWFRHNSRAPAPDETSYLRPLADAKAAAARRHEVMFALETHDIPGASPRQRYAGEPRPPPSGNGSFVFFFLVALRCPAPPWQPSVMDD